MWEIFKAELRYSMWGYLVFFATIPLLVLLNVVSEGGDRLYVVWFIIVMTLNYWNSKRIREKREFQMSQIPAARRDAGTARALMVVLVPAAYLLLYALIRGALGKGGLDPNHLGFTYGLVVIMFSGLLIFRDRYLGTKSLMRGKIMLIVILGALFGLGIYMMIVTEDAAETGGEAPAFLRAFDFVIKNHPLGRPVFVACFMGVSLLLAYISIITFRRRRTHMG
jgi:hypothetical protein